MKIVSPFFWSRSPFTHAITSSATSSAVMHASLGSVAGSNSPRSIGVSTAPGATANARTPIAAPSLAQLRAIRFSPALLAA